MNSRVSTLVSALLHGGLLLLLALTALNSPPLQRPPRGLEMEIIDREEAMAMPDPQQANAEPDSPREQAVQRTAPPAPLQPQPSPPSPAQAARPMPAPPVPVAPAAEAPALAPTHKIAPVPPAPPRDPAPAPVAKVAAAPTAPPVRVPAPRPRLDTGALARTIAGRDAGPRPARLNTGVLSSAIGKAAPRGVQGLSVRQKANLAEMIRSQITPCWSPPPPEEGSAGVTVLMRIQLARNGTTSGTPELIAARGASKANPAYVRNLAASVRRAVARCSPLKLPPELYDAWSDVELNFDPRDIQ